VVARYLCSLGRCSHRGQPRQSRKCGSWASSSGLERPCDPCASPRRPWFREERLAFLLRVINHLDAHCVHSGKIDRKV